MERQRGRPIISEEAQVEAVLKRIKERPDRIKALASNNEGKFRVLRVEKLVDGTEWFVGEFDTDLRALIFAKVQSLAAIRTHPDLTPSYYAFNPTGEQIDPKEFLFKKEILKNKLGRRRKF